MAIRDRPQKVFLILKFAPAQCRERKKYDYYRNEAF